MTGPWKPSPAMGQSIWDPCVGQIWIATHTARLSPSPVLTELSSNDIAQAHHSLSRKEHSASLPVPWSTPKLTVTLSGNEITAVHRISKLSDDELHYYAMKTSTGGKLGCIKATL